MTNKMTLIRERIAELKYLIGREDTRITKSELRDLGATLVLNQRILKCLEYDLPVVFYKQTVNDRMEYNGFFLNHAEMSEPFIAVMN